MKRVRLALAGLFAWCCATGLSLPVAAQDSTTTAIDSLHVPQVHYQRLANLEGFRLPGGEAWSPTEPRLLLVKRGTLYVVDVRDSVATPHLLLESQVLDVRWSPEGTYVACRVRVPTAMRGGAVRLQFVEAAGGPSESRVPRARIGTTVWADDGYVYFWNTRTGNRVRLQAPLSWRSKHPVLPATRRQHLLQISEARRGRPQVVLFAPQTPPTENVVAALMPPAATHVTIVEGFPMAEGEARFLVQMQPPGGSLRTYVVNGAGERLARLGDAPGLPSFVGTSVSADGHYVVGHRAKGGAGSLLSSELWLADSGGAWCTHVEGAGSTVASRLSRQDLYLAHEDPDGGAVRIGRLVIEVP